MVLYSQQHVHVIVNILHQKITSIGGGSGIFQSQISYIPEGSMPVCSIFIFQSKMLFQSHCDILYSFSFITSIHYSCAEISKYSIFFVVWKTIFNIQYSASSPDYVSQTSLWRQKGCSRDFGELIDIFWCQNSSGLCIKRAGEILKTTHTS